MPLSIGVSSWSNLMEEELSAIREHAFLKAAEPVVLDATKPKRRISIDVPYSIVTIFENVLENLCDNRGWNKLCFVPYQFDFNLCPDVTPPNEFWKDELHPLGWREDETLTVISALWAHVRWCDSTDAEYRKEAREYANRFSEEFEKWRGNGEDKPFDDEFYNIAYHYIEIGLLDCLINGINLSLPVVIYP